MNNFEDCQKDNPGITWKQYVDLRFNEAEKALRLAGAEMNRRLEGMNELRSQLDRQAATFITRNAYDIHLDQIRDRFRILEALAAANEARQRVYSLLISAAMSTMVGLIVYFLARR